MHSLNSKAASVMGVHPGQCFQETGLCSAQWKVYSHKAAHVPSVALLSAEILAEIQAASQMLLSAFLLCHGCLELDMA